MGDYGWGHELATTFSDYEGKETFDYGFDPLKLKPEDPEKLYELQTRSSTMAAWLWLARRESLHRSWLQVNPSFRVGAASVYHLHVMLRLDFRLFSIFRLDM